MVLDTNILIYAAKPGGEHLRSWIENPEATVSILSRIEAMGFPQLAPEEKAALEKLFSSLPEVTLSREIADKAIELRQLRRIGVADAIIAATALFRNLPLITRNVDDFKHVPNPNIVDPFSTDTSSQQAS